jgi:hypothetical protein
MLISKFKVEIFFQGNRIILLEIYLNIYLTNIRTYHITVKGITMLNNMPIHQHYAFLTEFEY